MYIMSRRFDNTWAVRKLKAKQSKMKSNGIILSKIKMANIENPLSVFETEPWINSSVCSQNYLLNQIYLTKILFLSTMSFVYMIIVSRVNQVLLLSTASVENILKIRKFAFSKEWYCYKIDLQGRTEEGNYFFNLVIN